MALSGRAIGIIIAAVIALAGGIVGILFATGVLGGGDATAPKSKSEYTVNFINQDSQHVSTTTVSANDSVLAIKDDLVKYIKDENPNYTIDFPGIFTPENVAAAIKDGTHTSQSEKILYKVSYVIKFVGNVGNGVESTLTIPLNILSDVNQIVLTIKNHLDDVKPPVVGPNDLLSLNIMEIANQIVNRTLDTKNPIEYSYDP